MADAGRPRSRALAPRFMKVARTLATHKSRVQPRFAMYRRLTACRFSGPDEQHHRSQHTRQ